MRLSPAAELAVRGAAVLAEHHGRGPTTLKVICAERDLPKQYLVKIFALLARANIITAIRGKKGGYALSRDPEDISLLEIVEAIEGPIALNFCQQDPPRCDELDCPIRPLWAELQETIREKLAGMTLAACISGKPRQAKKS